MTSNQPWWLTMPPAEVAATILPYFSSRAKVSEYRAMVDIVAWWKTGKYARSGVVWSADRFENPDYRAATEAIRVLEQAGLLMRAVTGKDLTEVDLGLTRRGMFALQTNTVRRHLGLGDSRDSAPTA